MFWPGLCLTYLCLCSTPNACFYAYFCVLAVLWILRHYNLTRFIIIIYSQNSVSNRLHICNIARYDKPSSWPPSRRCRTMVSTAGTSTILPSVRPHASLPCDGMNVLALTWRFFPFTTFSTTNSPVQSNQQETRRAFISHISPHLTSFHLHVQFVRNCNSPSWYVKCWLIRAILI